MDAEDIITRMINEDGHAGVVPEDAGKRKRRRKRKLGSLLT
jgi:hypothetical protein